MEGESGGARTERTRQAPTTVLLSAFHAHPLPRVEGEQLETEKERTLLRQELTLPERQQHQLGIHRQRFAKSVLFHVQYVVTDKVFNKLRAKRDDMRHGEGESQELDWPTAKRVCLKFALKCRTRHCVNRSLFVMRKRREDPQTFVARALKDRREGERELGIQKLINQ